MKITVKVEREFDIKYLSMVLPVKYDDEDMPYDFPFRSGEQWSVTVDIDEGKILDWPQGVSHGLFMKVTDGGVYQLLGPDKELVAMIQDYVPHSMVPGEYGDYVKLNIDESGVITNWKVDKSRIVSDFCEVG